MKKQTSFYEKLGKIDRRILFYIMIIAQAYVLINPIGLPVPIEDMVRDSYNAIEEVPEDAIILIAFDMDPGAWSEYAPSSLAVMRHVISRGIKFVGVAIHVEAVPLYEPFMAKLQADLDANGYVYGEDYVNCGFFSGLGSAVIGFATKWDEMVTTDAYGTPASELPILEGIEGIDDFYKEVGIRLGTGIVGGHWQSTWAATYGGKMIIVYCTKCGVGSTAYWAAGISRGIVPGLSGGAQYESLINRYGDATVQNDMVGISVIICLIYIFLGNVAHYGAKSESRRSLQ